MKRHILSWKLFVKDLFLPILTICFFLYINYLHINTARTVTGYLMMGDLTMLQKSLETSVLCFVFFIFISYYYLDKARHESLEECVRVMKGGLPALYGSQMGVLILLDFVFSAVMFGYNLYAYFAIGIGHAEIILHILACILLYIFALSLVAILLGALLAMKCNRLVSGMIMVFVVLLTSPIGLYMIEALYYNMHIDLFAFYEAICLFPRRTSTMPQHSIGYSLLPDRVSAILFFAALLLIPILLHVLKRQKTVKVVSTALCGVIVLSCGAVYVYPSSRILTDKNPKSELVADQFYYDSPDTVQLDEDGGFEITRYEMELKVGNFLKAQTTVYPDVSDRSNYKFTLYHGYKVKEITDQNGSSLNFTQNGDYIEVTRSEGEIRSLTFRYSGDSASYYAHAQGISLPGFFAYYPRSGYRLVYDTQSRSFYNLSLNDPAEFSLRLDYGREVYSNLEKTGENTFLGSSDGCTIVSGFYTEKVVNGTDIVYPYLDSEQFGNGFLERDMSQFLNGIDQGTYVKKIIILPYINAGIHTRCNYYSDGTVTCLQLRTLTDDFPLALVEDEKQNFFKVLRSYRDNRPDFESRLYSEKGDYSKSGEKGMAMLLDEAIAKLGEDAVLESSETYIRNSSDHRGAKEFLRELLQKSPTN